MPRTHRKCKLFMRTGWARDVSEGVSGTGYRNDRIPVRIVRASATGNIGLGVGSTSVVIGFFKSASDAHVNATLKPLYTAISGGFSFRRLALTAGNSDLVVCTWIESTSPGVFTYETAQSAVGSRGCPSDNNRLEVVRNRAFSAVGSYTSAGPDSYYWDIGSGSYIDGSYAALRYFNDGAADDLCFDYKPTLI